jgi:hypothetical protein
MPWPVATDPPPVPPDPTVRRWTATVKRNGQEIQVEIRPSEAQIAYERRLLEWLRRLAAYLP